MARQTKLKVFGTAAIMRYGRQQRTIIAASSRRVACEAIFGSPTRGNDLLGETGNPEEVAAAMAAPGEVLTRGLDDRDAPFMKESEL